MASPLELTSAAHLSLRVLWWNIQHAPSVWHSEEFGNVSRNLTFFSQKHFAQYGGIASVLGVSCRSAFYIGSFTIDSVTYHYDAFWTNFEQLLSDDPKSPRALSILKSVLAESHCSASYIIRSTIDSFTHHHDALWTILEQPPARRSQDISCHTYPQACLCRVSP